MSARTTPAPSGAGLASRPADDAFGHLAVLVWRPDDRGTFYRIATPLPSPWSAFFPVGTLLAAVGEVRFVQLEGEPFTPLSRDLWDSFFAWHLTLPDCRAQHAAAVAQVRTALAAFAALGASPARAGAA